MGKIYYVNGTILIRTKEFRYHAEDECLCNIPEGVDVLEANNVIEGSQCYVIDDINSLSIFDTFKASGGYTSLESGSYYFNSSYQEVYENYLLQKSELEKFANNVNDDNYINKSFAYKLMFMNVMTLLDSFVCELYISKLTSNEDLFFKQLNYVKEDNREKGRFKKSLKEYGPNEERAFIYYIRNQSYINSSKINEIIKSISSYEKDIIPEKSSIEKWIKLRHDVAHNNAREINGDFHRFTKDEIRSIMYDVDFLVRNIMDIIC